MSIYVRLVRLGQTLLRRASGIIYQLTTLDPRITNAEDHRQTRLLLTLYLAFIFLALCTVAILAAQTTFGIQSARLFVIQSTSAGAGIVLALVLYLLTRTILPYKTSALIMIGAILIACIVATARLENPLALVFLNLGTLLGALFLSPRLAILIILINAVIPPVLVSLVPSWNTRPITGEIIFLVFNSLINLVIVVIRQSDLNKIERQSQALIEAERQQIALAAERERVSALNHFIGDVSHDFRTPLAIINSALYILKRTTDPQQQERILTIEQQTDRLLRLLEDMVAVVRLDSAALLSLEDVPVNALIEETTAKLTAQFQSKKLTLRLDLDGQLPSIRADYDLLKLILNNLLDNAIRYNRAGGSIIVMTQQAGDQVVLRIADTGVGIDAAHLPHIFDLLYRADQARSTSTGGAGLGLSIAKKVVEAHGGTISVASTLDQGTTFTITLPVIPCVVPAPPVR